MLLHLCGWTQADIVNRYRMDATKLLVSCQIKPQSPPQTLNVDGEESSCPVCLASLPSESFNRLSCGHSFCKDCWTMHFEVQINQGMATGRFIY